MKQKPDILETRDVASSRFFSVEEVDLKFQNGELRTFERLRGGLGRGAVLVVPWLDDETLVLIREYAVGTDRYELAFPKGLVEKGEDPLEAANREMKEEIGYGANQLELLRIISTSPGYMAARMTCVMAQDLYPERLTGDEPEEIEVVPWKISELDKLLAQEDFTEARSIAALFLALEQKKRAK